MRIVIFALFLTTTGSTHDAIAQQGFLSNVYSAVLGDHDVRLEYRECTYRALKTFGIKNPTVVAVKQMNAVGSSFARAGLSSFTAFGIWLDQEYLDQCSREERIFTIYHETAHYVCKHHQKIVGGTIIGSACLLSLFLAGLKQLDVSNLKKYLLLMIANIAADAAYYGYLLPPIVKEQEKQADIMAAHALIRSGKKQVVESYIQQLKQSPAENQKSALWWYSDAQRAAYLEKTLKNQNLSRLKRSI